jgi:hypothetical protein
MLRHVFDFESASGQSVVETPEVTHFIWDYKAAPSTSRIFLIPICSPYVSPKALAFFLAKILPPEAPARASIAPPQNQKNPATMGGVKVM